MEKPKKYADVLPTEHLSSIRLRQQENRCIEKNTEIATPLSHSCSRNLSCNFSKKKCPSTSQRPCDIILCPCLILTIHFKKYRTLKGIQQKQDFLYRIVSRRFIRSNATWRLDFSCNWMKEVYRTLQSPQKKSNNKCYTTPKLKVVRSVSTVTTCSCSIYWSKEEILIYIYMVIQVHVGSGNEYKWSGCGYRWLEAVNDHKGRIRVGKQRRKNLINTRAGREMSNE